MDDLINPSAEMGDPLAPLTPRRRDGYEPLPNGSTLLAFWQWMGSDLVSNTLRGAFGEYLVSLAVGAADGVQEEWADYDVRTSDGLRIEVKTSGYVQSWKQSNLSSPTFDIGRKQGWDAGTNTFTEHKRRWSDVYVFCLHHYQDKISIDPLDMTQWTFYVLATTVLEREIPEQKRIGLGSLKRLGTISVQFEGISDAIRTAVANR